MPTPLINYLKYYTIKNDIPSILHLSYINNSHHHYLLMPNLLIPIMPHTIIAHTHHTPPLIIPLYHLPPPIILPPLLDYYHHSLIIPYEFSLYYSSYLIYLSNQNYSYKYHDIPLYTTTSTHLTYHPNLYSHTHPSLTSTSISSTQIIPNSSPYVTIPPTPHASYSLTYHFPMYPPSLFQNTNLKKKKLYI